VQHLCNTSSAGEPRGQNTETAPRTEHVRRCILVGTLGFVRVQTVRSTVVEQNTHILSVADSNPDYAVSIVWLSEVTLLILISMMRKCTKYLIGLRHHTPITHTITHHHRRHTHIAHPSHTLHPHHHTSYRHHTHTHHHHRNHHRHTYTSTHTHTSSQASFTHHTPVIHPSDTSSHVIEASYTHTSTQ
jgi:hypothetical protein